MTPPLAEAAAVARGAVKEGKRAGPIILLCLALLCVLVLLGWERLHGEAKANEILDRWTGEQHQIYAEKVEADRTKFAGDIAGEQKALAEKIAAELKERDALLDKRMRVVEESSARTSESIIGIQREQQRQGAQIDRVLERLPPR